MGVGASNCGLQRRRRHRRRSSDRLEEELGRNLGGEVVAPPAGAEEGRESRWSDLPPELAGMVFCRLLSHGDRARFRAVCSDWRLASRQQATMAPGSLPPSLPWLGLDRRTYQSLPDGEVHRFSDGPGIMVCRGSFDGWLLYYRNGYHEISSHILWNPFSGAMLDLPSHCDSGGGEPLCFDKAIKRKIVVCSPDLVAAAVDHSSLIFHLPNMHSSWAMSNPNIWCHDIAFYHGKLYSVTKNDELFVHEFFTTTDRGGSARVTASSAPVTDARPPTDHLGNNGYHRLRLTYLVVSLTGKLLLVRWSLPHVLFAMLSQLITVRVFEADLEARRWTEVMDLGVDQALFVSRTCSKAVRLPQPDNRHGFLRGNRVFIVGSDLEIDCSSCGVYDMSDGRFSVVSLNRWRAGHEQSSRYTGVEQTVRSEWFFPSEL